MKSKFTFIILILSFILNIAHDSIIAKELKSCDGFNLSLDKPIQVEKIDNCCSKNISTLHDMFHFLAILPTKAIHFSPIIDTHLFSTLSTPLSCIKETSFRPPIV